MKIVRLVGIIIVTVGERIDVTKWEDNSVLRKSSRSLKVSEEGACVGQI